MMWISTPKIALALQDFSNAILSLPALRLTNLPVPPLRNADLKALADAMQSRSKRASLPSLKALHGLRFGGDWKICSCCPEAEGMSTNIQKIWMMIPFFAMTVKSDVLHNALLLLYPWLWRSWLYATALLWMQIHWSLFSMLSRQALHHCLKDCS